MIILSHRVTARDLLRTVAPHVLQGLENDSVAVLAGGLDHLTECVEAAEVRGVTYAARHWKLSPERPIDDHVAFAVVKLLAQDFRFDPQRITLVRHGKTRHGAKEQVPHFHLLVPEYDPANSKKVLRTSHDFLCHEKASRIIEVRLGHPLVPGPHHVAVVRQLEAEGRQDIADAIRHLSPSREPGTVPTSYSTATAAQIARAGLKPAEVVALVRDAWSIASDGVELGEILAPYGITIAPGERRETTLCVYADGQHLEALHRMLGIQVAEVRRFLSVRTPSHDRAAAPASPRPVETPVEPLPPMLSDAEVRAEIERQIKARVPVPQDRRRIEENRVSARKHEGWRDEQAGKLEVATEELTRLEASIAAMGWLGRTVFHRSRHASLLKTRAEKLKGRNEADRCASMFAENASQAMASMRREEQRIANVEASEKDAFDREKRRLLLTLDAIQRQELRFADLAELQAYMASGAATAPQQTITHRRPPPGPRAPGM